MAKKIFKKERSIIWDKWEIIKAKAKVKDPDLEELDHLTCDLIAHLAILTERKIKYLDGISINTYKDRVWWMIEKLGLLPEYRDEEDNEEELLEIIKDEWESVDDDFEMEIDDSKFYK